MKYFAIFLACGLAANGVAGVTAQTDQKPVKTTVQNAYEPGHFTSMEELWRMATAVLEVDIAGMEPRDRVVTEPVGRIGPTPPPQVETAFAARVRTVHKAAATGVDAGAGQTITIVRRGGSRDRGSYIEEVIDERFPLFKVGERYVLFLIGGTETYRYFGVVSADGVFRVVDERISPIGAGAFVKRWKDQPLSALNQELSSLGREK